MIQPTKAQLKDPRVIALRNTETGERSYVLTKFLNGNTLDCRRDNIRYIPFEDVQPEDWELRPQQPEDDNSDPGYIFP